MEWPTGSPRASAVYLRCYPRDDWAMMDLRRVMEDYAFRLGLPWPSAYIDNGVSSRQAAPRRADLETAVAAGDINVVLIPGPWVFTLDDEAARQVVHRLTGRGCEVIELPRLPAAAGGASPTDRRPLFPHCGDTST